MAWAEPNHDEPLRLSNLGEWGSVCFRDKIMAGATKRAGAGSKHLAQNKAFTLIELLIVVTILAIIAATVIPAFVDSNDDARDATLLHNLQAVRHQIQIYRVQHNGKWPGTGGMPAMIHLMAYTNADGGISVTKSSSHPYGPYLPGQGLVNPFNGAIGWKNSSDPPNETPNEAMTTAGNVVVGWFYDPNTGRISANAEGSNADGTPRVKL